MTAIPKPTPRPKKATGRPRRARKARPGRITIKRLDDLARPLCRGRGACEAMGYLMYGPVKGCSNQLQWAHVISRTYKTAIRWSRDNCLCLCSGHHKYFTDRPVEWKRFLTFKLGDSNVYTLEAQALAEQRVKSDRTSTLVELLSAALELGWTNRLVIR